MRLKILAISLLWLTAAACQTLSFSQAVKKAMPCVVSIQAEKSVQNEINPLMQDPMLRFFFGDQAPGYEPMQKIKALGSGVIVKNGYVLTNYHVIKDTDNIMIKLNDGREFPAKIAGKDAESDIAFLKIDEKNLPIAEVGNAEQLEVGDIVLAIGNPFGVGQTVTQGIVSATQRKNVGLNIFESYIQTDAAINPGNSGGALINLNGQVIGINTAIISRSGGNNGIGFAIPINFALQIMDEILTDGAVVRGWLGIHMDELTKEMKESLPVQHGVIVRSLFRQSPAAKAGLLPGDIITYINGVKIENANAAREVVSKLKPKQKIQVIAWRDKDELLLAVTVGQRKSS